MPKNKRIRRSDPTSASSSTSAPYSLSSRNNSSSQSSTSSNNASKSASSNLIAPNTSLGQHFLKNPAVVTAIVAKAAIKSTDSVLEIGPGTGNMTIPLLQQSKHVVAIEYDTRTHHTNMDTYDHLIPEDLKQASTIVAAFVYNTAQMDEKLPRKELPKARGRGGRGF